MPAYSLIIGHPHDPASPAVVIAGPEVPYQDQRDRFKAEFMAPRDHETYQSVELLDSRRGISKRKLFITPEEAARRAAALGQKPAKAPPKPPKSVA